jgi:uncharacterized protein YfaS (alpha-2-macroglobulin family)
MLLQLKEPTLEETAYLILAGRRKRNDLFDEIPAAPPGAASPETIRAAALAVRALHRVDPADKRIAAYTEWLMRHRRGGAWYSTLDTAYVVYAMAETDTGRDEIEAAVELNGKTVALTRGRAVLPGTSLRKGDNTVQVTHTAGEAVFASALLRYYTAKGMDKPAEAGLSVARTFQRVHFEGDKKRLEELKDGSTVNIGDRIQVSLRLGVPLAESYVMMESPIAAGAEPRHHEEEKTCPCHSWYCRAQFRDDRACFASSSVKGADNTLRFYLRPTLPGTYRILPATAFTMYDPAKSGSSRSFVLRVAPKKKASARVRRR